MMVAAMREGSLHTRYSHATAACLGESNRKHICVSLLLTETMGARSSSLLLMGILLGCSLHAAGQEISQVPPQMTESEKLAFLDRVIANQKNNEQALDIYERVERVEVRKTASEAQPSEIRFSRVVPAGTGLDRIALGADGKPADAAAYRAELEKLERALVWASSSGRAQRDAYEKIAKKQKERNEILEATRNGFLYTFVSRELRDGRTLAKYRLEPNPAFKATSRPTSIFSKVRAIAWIDEDSGQIARVEVEVVEDISFGLFLGKIYKGSHFMQERYEVAPGVWLASFLQYDFDGRKFFLPISVHERTFYSDYRRIGPPKEALALIRAELGKSDPAMADP
jgi:hypothetical protein